MDARSQDLRCTPLSTACFTTVSSVSNGTKTNMSTVCCLWPTKFVYHNRVQSNSAPQRFVTRRFVPEQSRLQYRISAVSLGRCQHQSSRVDPCNSCSSIPAFNGFSFCHGCGNLNTVRSVRGHNVLTRSLSGLILE